ncbi:MAG: 2-oxoacid:acceptor oxidoreductase family protein [Candidatus Moranbacteria bacterium]|nr:2-oxoacid:acceptor oxidoreductase family protein [Candidatus Moranbacteria bacterium]MDZ4385406.1 2-oxoacid:acceptor oxidoreductase family protein [Candidatus Moranbacteria bacterium]
MKYHKDIFEIIFHARGGQGAKAAAEIIAQAAVSEGKFVQAFPQFGPERSGAPTKTFVRISDKAIRTYEPVIDPDVVVVLDETILDSETVTANLDSDEALIVNTKKTVEQIRQKLTERGAGFEGRIYPIDANGISMEIVGQPRPNTVILGKFVQVTEAVDLASVTAEFGNIFEYKIGKEATDKNILAIEKAYDTI